jgi:acetyltransferase-like isoleucine patch superfamily enzyme
MPIFRVLKRRVKTLLQSIGYVINIIRYDDITIVNYYRKQGAQIGEDCRINVRNAWPEPELITLGNHVFVSWGVVFHTHDGAAWVLREQFPGIKFKGKIVIEDNCMIGFNAQILSNVRIGSNSIVGAGSVVISDVPPNSIVMGIPARIIGSTLKYKEKHIALWNEELAKRNQRPEEPKNN